jgi:hypothetical protein
MIVIQALAAVWLIGRARAHSAEALHSLGAHLVSLRAADAGTVHSLFVNGAEFKTVTFRTTKNVADVLAAFRRACAGRGGLAGDGVLELADENRGLAICFDSPISYSADSLLEALNRFVTTGDLMSIGNVRYVRVWRSERGGTAAALVWTEGPIRLFEMFPADGDAPGRDTPGIPRPPQARRLLSSWEATRKSAVTVYVTSIDPEQTRLFYERELDQRGFRRYHTATAPQKSGPVLPLLVTRDEWQVLLSFQADNSGRTLVTVAVL